MKTRSTIKLLITIGAVFALLVAAACGGGTDEELVTVVGAQTDSTATATATSTAPQISQPTTTASAVATPTADPDANASVSGTVTYRERIALTPGAVVSVQLRDTSLMDVASELIAEQVITNPGQVPISFDVRYNSGDINPRHTYSIQVRITESDGRLAFINDTAYDVITRGNPTRIDMVLVIVQPPPDPTGEWTEENSRQFVEEEAEVIGAYVLEYQPEVLLVVDHYMSNIDNCDRRGNQSYEISGTDIFVTITLMVPPPTPWAIDCDADVVMVDEIFGLGDALTPGQTYRVIVNGTEATTFTAPLANTQ